MRNPFLKPNNPLLTKISRKVAPNQICSQEIQKIINKMLKIAYGEQRDINKPVMVGLAAPQIGIPKRIILVDIGADGKGKVGNLKIYINPQITWKSKRVEEWYEGCYSISGVCGIVSRSKSIRIQGFRFTPSRCEPKFVKEKFTGYVARIFQHEIDHLNGIFFFDHISNPDKLHLVKKSEFHLYRNKQAWKNWPKKYQKPLAYGKLKGV